MINLISLQSKRTITRQYWLRIGIVGSSIVCGFCLLGIILMVPSYILTVEKEKVAIARAEELHASKDFQENKELGDIVVKTKKQLDAFNQLQQKYISDAVTPILEQVTAKKGKIRLQEISYQTNEEKMSTIKIKGIATSRNELLDFVGMLKADTTFSRVDVPVSSFVQNIDSTFEIVLVIAQETL